MSVKTFRERVDIKVRDGAEIIDKADVEKIIIDALPVFSKDSPVIKSTSVDGDGGYDYTLPTGWVEGFSIVKGIEYPGGQQIPIYLEPEDWQIYDNGTVQKLRFLVYTPGTTETFIVVYTIPYLEATIDNIPATHIDAFCELAASLVCAAIANFYAQSSDSTIDVDSIDYGNKSGQWTSLAKTHKKNYDDFVGKQDGVKPASQTADWDISHSWPDRDGLTHPRKSR